MEFLIGVLSGVGVTIIGIYKLLKYNPADDYENDYENDYDYICKNCGKIYKHETRLHDNDIYCIKCDSEILN